MIKKGTVLSIKDFRLKYNNPYAMFAVPVEPNSRKLKIQIERPVWFEGFIHQGKWIAGDDSVGSLIKLAKFNLK